MKEIIDLETQRKEYFEKLKTAETCEETNLILGMIDSIEDRIDLILNKK